MLTVADLQRIAQAEMSTLPIEESERQAELELIVLHLSGLSLSERFREPERVLDDRVLDSLQQIIERRKQREPIQYCLGEAYFFGRKFAVRQGVLVPRADTEILLEAANKYAAKNLTDNSLIGEIGIGTGIISISVLSEHPHLIASACDISAEAINVAEENALRHGVVDRLRLFSCDWMEWLEQEGKSLNLLLSNPPYIPFMQKQELAPEVRDWEPELALFGGEDGLAFYRRLAAVASRMLSGETPIFLEIGLGQADLVRDIFAKYDWCLTAVHKDLGGIDRVLCFAQKNCLF